MIANQPNIQCEGGRTCQCTDPLVPSTCSCKCPPGENDCGGASKTCKPDNESCGTTCRPVGCLLLFLPSSTQFTHGQLTNDGLANHSVQKEQLVKGVNVFPQPAHPPRRKSAPIRMILVSAPTTWAVRLGTVAATGRIHLAHHRRITA